MTSSISPRLNRFEISNELEAIEKELFEHHRDMSGDAHRFYVAALRSIRLARDFVFRAWLVVGHEHDMVVRRIQSWAAEVHGIAAAVPRRDYTETSAGHPLEGRDQVKELADLLWAHATTLKDDEQRVFQAAAVCLEIADRCFGEVSLSLENRAESRLLTRAAAIDQLGLLIFQLLQTMPYDH